MSKKLVLLLVLSLALPLAVFAGGQKEAAPWAGCSGSA